MHVLPEWLNENSCVAWTAAPGPDPAKRKSPAIPADRPSVHDEKSLNLTLGGAHFFIRAIKSTNIITTTHPTTCTTTNSSSYNYSLYHDTLFGNGMGRHPLTNMSSCRRIFIGMNLGLSGFFSFLMSSGSWILVKRTTGHWNRFPLGLIICQHKSIFFLLILKWLVGVWSSETALWWEALSLWSGGWGSYALVMAARYNHCIGS